MSYKKLFSGIVLACWLMNGSLAQRQIHLLVVAQTNDPNIGQGCDINASRMINQVSDLCSAAKLPLQKIVLKGNQVSALNIYETIKNLKIDSSDVVIFHYSGHGTAVGQPNDWPRFLINDPQKKASLDKIHAALKAKKPRLLLSLADCCNGGVVPNNQPQARSESTAASPKEIQTFRNLFLEQRGSFMASASKRGSQAYYDAVTGGYFTVAFLHALYQEAQQKPPHRPNWESVFKSSLNFTREVAKGWGKNQEAQFKRDAIAVGVAAPPQDVSGPSAFQAAPTVNAEPVYEPIKYQVKNGDSLLEIAEVNRVKVEDIKKWNKLTSDNIKVGQELTLYRRKR